MDAQIACGVEGVVLGFVACMLFVAKLKRETSTDESIATTKILLVFQHDGDAHRPVTHITLADAFFRFNRFDGCHIILHE